ncbi:MAG: PQQ-binding-like beta-propeller repeat protein [Vicinamibacterales bacterium]
MLRAPVLAAVVVGLLGAPAFAEDWPEIRGVGRRGVWNETGILDTFPKDGLPVVWRAAVKQGYAGPAVADGRAFVTDFSSDADGADGAEGLGGSRPRLTGTERAIALDERTGRVLWTQRWPANYGGIIWANGPRATPTVDGSRVFVLGAAGQLLALNVESGEVLWRRDYARDFGVDRRHWAWDYGFAGSPIIDGPRLICFVGGPKGAMVVALDKATGREVWRALQPGLHIDLGVSQPIIITAGGVRQLVVWLTDGVFSLDPATGKTHWQQGWLAENSMTAPTPVFDGTRLFFTNFYTGSLMLALDPKRAAARLLWKGKGASEIDTDALHGVVTTPVIIGDYIYGICSYGQFRCLRASTGERIWESQALVGERARWASAQIVRNGDRLFVNTDQGDLVIVQPDPSGYKELGRTPLIRPTSPPYNRRKLERVNWSHPAYANRRIYARNDEEIIAVSLARDGR